MNEKTKEKLSKTLRNRGKNLKGMLLYLPKPKYQKISSDELVYYFSRLILE